MKKRKYTKIKTIKTLRKAINTKSYTDFAMILGGGGMFSRKEIMWDKEAKKFLINNCIDDSEQDLTEKQLFNVNYTNIGDAMKKGAFYKIN